MKTLVCSFGQSRKGLLFRLASRYIREVYQECDENGITYARKAMIITGMDLNTNG